MSIKKTALLLGGYRVLSHTEVCANIGLYLMVSGAAGFSVILQTHRHHKNLIDSCYD